MQEYSFVDIPFAGAQEILWSCHSYNVIWRKPASSSPFMEYLPATFYQILISLNCHLITQVARNNWS